MKNKGFTLLELICALVLLSLVLIIAIPSIMYKVNDQRDKISDLTQKLIFNATNLYTEDYKTISDLNDGSNYCITLDTLVQEGYLKAPLKDAKTGKEIPLNKYVRGTINKLGDLDNLEISDDCTLAAGLYDDNDNLIASWDELVNTYGLKVDKDTNFGNYTIDSQPGTYAYVVKNNEVLNEGVKLIISKSIKRLGQRVFEESQLKTIILPNSLTKIGGYAFRNETSLTEIIIPDSVIEIGSNAFDGCSNLEKVTLSKNIKKLSFRMFNECVKLKNIKIPYGVTEIDTYAFYRCKSLESIVMPDTITDVGSYSFGGDEKLKKVTLSKKLTYIPYSCFSSCSSLEKIVIPDSVTIINQYAFNFCSKLKKVVLPKKLKQIGNAAFNACAIKEISLPSTLTSIGRTAFAGNDFEKIVIPSGVKIIKKETFERCYYLTSVTLHDDITEIEEGAFKSTGIKKIVLPSSLTKIGKGAFYMSDLKEITIPTGVTSIGDEAFFQTKIESITIPKNVTSIGEKVFYNCFYLKRIDVDSDNQNYSSVDGVLLDKNKTIVIICPQKKSGSFTIPSSVTSIEDYAFMDCIELTDVVIPNGVTTIGNYVFYICNKLTNITIPSSVTFIGNNNFVTGTSNGKINVTFENTTGWYVTEDKDATSGTPIDVSDSSANAANFKGTYHKYYWKRSS